MGCCFGKSNKFLKNQMKDEYYNKKVNMSIIGNYKPHQVFIGEEMNIRNISALNSLCDCDIHLSLANNPLRLIISYMDLDLELGNYKKGFTFHIYKIEYKELNDISEITQYDIYNAIQDYIHKNNQFPKNDNIIIPI